MLKGEGWEGWEGWEWAARLGAISGHLGEPLSDLSERGGEPFDGAPRWGAGRAACTPWTWEGWGPRDSAIWRAA
jgi:hypothetical protein